MIVILGHTGFIGGHLCRYFSGRGRRVAGLSSRECDLAKPERVREWFRRLDAPFDLIHSAVINRDQCQGYGSFQSNCQMLQNVLEHIPSALCRSFTYLSSVDVYGRRPPCPITEETLPAPHDYYGLAKLSCEGLLRLAPGPGFPVAVLRLPGVYGVEDGGRSLVGKLARAVCAQQPVTLSGTGGVRRDYVSVGDLALVVETLLERPREIIVNVATGQSLSLLDIVAIIAEKVQCRPEIIFQSQAGRGADLVFDTSRFQESFPTIRLTPLAAGIEGYLADLR